MEYGKQSGDNRCRFRTDDEPFGVSSDADHYKCLKRPKMSDDIRNSRMPNLNRTVRGEISCKTQICCDFKTRGRQERSQHYGYNHLCKWYGKGIQCPYGDRCRFLHQDIRNAVGDGSIAVVGHKLDSSLRVMQEHKPVGISLRAQQEHKNAQSRLGAEQENRHFESSLRANQERRRLFYWKTKLCNKWEAVNECPYGSKCSYAHGLAELLPLSSSRYGNVSSSSFVGRAKDEDTENAQVEGNKRSIRWKTFNKLIGIYADWIDDDVDTPTQPNSI